MICPVCNRKSQYAVCPRCGYYLENDITSNNLLNNLSSKEIKNYNKSIQKQKEIYKEYNELKKQRDRINKEKAKELYNKGCRYFRLRMYSTAENYLLQASEYDHTEACFYLGLMYRYGKDAGYRNIQKDSEKAFRYFLQASKKDRVSQRIVGDMYLSGEGVKVNEKEGLKIYDRLISRGYLDAYETLIQYYNNGYGCIKKNRMKAEELKRKYKDKFKNNS